MFTIIVYEILLQNFHSRNPVEEMYNAEGQGKFRYMPGIHIDQNQSSFVGIEKEEKLNLIKQSGGHVFENPTLLPPLVPSFTTAPQKAPPIIQPQPEPPS